MRSTAFHFLHNDQGSRTGFHIHPLVRFVFPSLEKQRRHQSFGQVLSVGALQSKKSCMEEFCHPNKNGKRNLHSLKMNGWNLKIHQIENQKHFPNLHYFSVPAANLLKGRLSKMSVSCIFLPDSESVNQHLQIGRIAHG